MLIILQVAILCKHGMENIKKGVGFLEFPRMMTVAEAVKASGLTEFTVRQLVKNGRIKFIRLGKGLRGKLLINADSLVQYLNGENDAD